MSDLSRRSFLKLGAGSCVSLLVPGVVGCAGDKAGKQDGGLSAEGDSGGDVPEKDSGADLSTVHAILADELSELYDLGKQAADVLGISKNSLTGAKVFIKPNILAFGLTPFVPDNGECTKLEIVFGVAEMCLEAGAAKVVIADGAQGISWDWQDAVFCPGNVIHGAADIKSAADYLNTEYGDSKVELLCLNEVDQWNHIPSCSDEPIMKNGLMIAKSFYEADHVISIGPPKSHVYAQMTASIKNYFGVVPIVHMGMGGGTGRTEAHKVYYFATCGGVENVGVTGAFMDILKWRQDEGKEDFAILDCSIGMEGDGPSAPPFNNGITIHHKDRNKIGKYFLLASKDLVAADAIAAQIMGFSFEEVKQFAVARNLGLGEIDNIRLTGAELDDLIIHDWLKPTPIDEAIFLATPSPAPVSLTEGGA